MPLPVQPDLRALNRGGGCCYLAVAAVCCHCVDEWRTHVGVLLVTVQPASE